MSDVPKKMWREAIPRCGMYLDGGAFYHESPPKVAAVEYVHADLVPQWRTVGDDTPKDVVLLLGWRGYRGEWETCTDNYVNTRSGSMHGQATHWMPLPEPPTP